MTAVLEDLLTSVLDCTFDAVVMTDDDGVIVYVNSPLMRLFGYTDDTDSPVGMSIGVLLTKWTSKVDVWTDPCSPSTSKCACSPTPRSS